MRMPEGASIALTVGGDLVRVERDERLELARLLARVRGVERLEVLVDGAPDFMLLGEYGTCGSGSPSW